MDTNDKNDVFWAMVAASQKDPRERPRGGNGPGQERLVMHDVAAALGIIVREASRLDAQSQLGDEDRGRIRRITELADRGKNLIVRKQDQLANEERSADPNATLLGAQDMLARTPSQGIRVLVDLQEPIWRVHGDPVLLDRAVANLVVNAEEAMPDGGEIILGSANVHLDEDRARALDLTGGPYVRISVTNTGACISDEIRPHIFRSSFTTKGARGCRGLGLTVVQETAMDVGGAIRLEDGSRTTTFALYMPAARQNGDSTRV